MTLLYLCAVISFNSYIIAMSVPIHLIHYIQFVTTFMLCGVVIMTRLFRSLYDSLVIL
jgi:hypothetical protein